MTKQRPEKGKAPVGGTTEALSVKTPPIKEGFNMSDSKAVQVSSQPVFNFGAHSVRVVVRDGEPWFVASDVCGALEYKNTSKAVADHLDDDERMTIAAGDSHSNDSNQSLESKGTQIVSPIRSRGGARHTVVINESGLYALVLRSRKPEARKFAKWVTGEVLPAIRKTGIYVGKPFTVNPGDVLTQEEQNTLRLMLKTAVEKLPKERQGAAMMQGWSKLKAHFGVPYRDIPRQEFSEAVSIIARHTAQWEIDPSEAQPVADPSRTKAAFDAASQAAASVQSAVFNAVLEGDEEWKFGRWMLAFIDDSARAAPAYVMPIGHGDFISNWQRLVKDVANGECMCTSAELLDMASACMQRLQQRKLSNTPTQMLSS